MNDTDARALVGRYHRAVLATSKRDGRPQLANIVYLLDSDGLIKISTRGASAKALNLRRDPRASLAVEGDNWGEYLVVEGSATVRDGPAVLPELRHVYEAIAGQPHPDWAEFDEAMVREGRVILAITPERFYPLDR